MKKSAAHSLAPAPRPVVSAADFDRRLGRSLALRDFFRPTTPRLAPAPAAAGPELLRT